MLKDTFDSIYYATYDRVLAYTLRKCGKVEEIRDIVQETYTELFKTLVKRGEGYLKCPEAFVMRLAKSKVYQYYSEKERQMAQGLAEYVDVTKQESETISNVAWEDSLLDKLTAEEVMEYISEKDELTRDIFYQHYFQDKTLKEIADAHGVKESTVKTRLYRTLRELKGMKRFAIIAAVLLLAALLAKPVYTLAEELVSYLKSFYTKDSTWEILELGAAYKKYSAKIEKGELPKDVLININGESYTIKELEKVWLDNPWLAELDWDNSKVKKEGERDFYFEVNYGTDGGILTEGESVFEEPTVVPVDDPKYQ